MERKKKSEIVIIFNRYKDNLDDFIDSLDPKCSDQLRPIDKRLCNTPKSRDGSTSLLKKIA